jgi:hypothetical protein
MRTKKAKPKKLIVTMRITTHKVVCIEAKNPDSAVDKATGAVEKELKRLGYSDTEIEVDCEGCQVDTVVSP